MRLAVSCALLVLVLSSVGACVSRPDLPLAVEPLTPTPDAPFRSRPRAFAEVPLPSLDIEWKTLSNGLTVAYVERPGAPVDAVEYVNREAGTLGTACGGALMALTGEALTRGGTHWRGDVLSNLVVDGARVAVETDPESSAIGLYVLDTAFDQAVEVLARTVREPAFVAGGVELARNALLDQLREWSENSSGLAWQFALRNGLGEAARVIFASDVDGLQKIASGEVRRCYEEHFRPSSSAIVIAGSVPASVAFETVERHFGDWLAPLLQRPNPPLHLAFRTPPPGIRIALVVQGAAASRAAVFLAQRAPPATDPDYAAGLVASKVLGGVFDSRLNRALRHDLAATYGVRTSISNYGEFGILFVHGQFAPSQTAEAIRGLLAEIERLRNSELTDAELRMAKLRVRVELATALSGASGTAGIVAQHFMRGNRQLLAQLDLSLTRVDAKSVQRVARTNFRADADDFVVIGNARALLEDLREVGTVELYQITEH